MYICFAEYRIAEESRLSFLELTNKLLQHEMDMYLYEGTDQPNLFVEVWHAPTSAEAEQIKKERCGERSSWSEVSSYIVGGQAKLHVWTFKPVHPNKQDAVSG